MSNTCTAGISWLLIGVVLLGLVAAAACAPKASRRQTEIMENTGKVSVSAAVLRVRVNDLVERFAGKIEQTADRIIAEAEDDAVRRRALIVKADAIPAVYMAGFRADPLAAAVGAVVPQSSRRRTSIKRFFVGRAGSFHGTWYCRMWGVHLNDDLTDVSQGAEKGGGMAAGGAGGDGPMAGQLIGMGVFKGRGCNQKDTTRRI